MDFQTDFNMKDLAARYDIPHPVLFNAFKHHRNYILDIVRNETPETIIDLLEPLCNNYVDVYTGVMSPTAIAGAVISSLESGHVLLPEDFTGWVTRSRGYRKIVLDDGSEWIIRKSDNARLYIHIHPARSGLFTRRFKGSTLKTVCLLKNIYGNLPEPLSLVKVNHVRARVGLSPIKNLERNKGILNCYAKFFG
jgi:hypothetical protein